VDESARLDAIERRQSVVIALLVGGYLLAGCWLLLSEVAWLTAWHVGSAAVVVAVVAAIVGISRRRRARA